MCVPVDHDVVRVNVVSLYFFGSSSRVFSFPWPTGRGGEGGDEFSLAVQL